MSGRSVNGGGVVQRRSAGRSFALSAWVGVALIAACSSSSSGPGFGSLAGSDGGSGGGGSDGGTSLLPPTLNGEGGSPSSPDATAPVEQPATCADAASAKSYVGCEFWPTVVFNPVWSVFDFAAVVGNASTQPAQVAVDRGGTQVATVTVAPGDVGVVYLPWVNELKGGDFDNCTLGARPTTSGLVPHGAYHLTSTVPVTVWQFSPLEYEAKGGPSGKTWTCPYAPASCNGDGINCLSVNNGASLLLPTAALTGNYRLFGQSSSTYGNNYPAATDMDSPGGFAITATADGTKVKVSLLAGASVEAGTGVTATAGPGTLDLTLNSGDVATLLGTRGTTYNAPDSDLSGSVVSSNNPIQVIAFNAITDYPSPLQAGDGWADHLEETVLPGEALGAHYVVAPPTAPAGNAVGHYVRFYGNRDGTTLAYTGTPPAGAPTSLSAGQVVDLTGPVTAPFEVTGSHEFAIASIMMGSQAQDPSSDPRGDPSLTFEVAVEQYRHTDVFLAPNDYDVSYADVILPTGAKVTIDGAAATGPITAIGTQWSILREPLGPGKNGAHTLQADQPVGVQIMGFGHATAYYTPGGLNLNRIAPPPPPPPPPK